MRVLLDTNVVIDLSVSRLPWVEEAKAIWEATMLARLQSCIPASALTDTFYIVRRLVGREAARNAVRQGSLAHRSRCGGRSSFSQH